jgi:hypothetical protein
MTTTETHTAHCIKMAVIAISENNLATEALEGHYGATPETDEEAAEWLANGNIGCQDAGRCGE